MTETCDICGGTLHYAEVHVGHGDGDGQHFAHEVCYWRERAHRFESELAAVNAEVQRLVKALSTIQALEAHASPPAHVHPDILRINGDYR